MAGAPGVKSPEPAQSATAGRALGELLDAAFGAGPVGLHRFGVCGHAAVQIAPARTANASMTAELVNRHGAKGVRPAYALACD